MLVELKDLVSTLSIGIADAVTVHVRDMSPRYLTGTGKAKELMDHAKALGCDAIIFDNELSPGQQRAQEADSGLCVIDRHEVILDIFNLRARTREARLQVALARMEYSMSRLTRMWTTGPPARRRGRAGGGGGGAGGGGAARGEGELQLEIDRRLANKRVEKLRAELVEVRKQRDTQRKERSRMPLPHGAIVGYTNAGKSSLLNARRKVMCSPRTSSSPRSTPRPGGWRCPMVSRFCSLIPSASFARLPHDLVQSFRATLEEANLADFLIHVVDATHESAEKFMVTTVEVLGEIGAGGKKTILAFNKIDLVTDPSRLQELKHRHPDAVMISVKTGAGMDDLLHRIHEMVFDRVVRLDLRLPMNRLDLLALAIRRARCCTRSMRRTLPWCSA